MTRTPTPPEPETALQKVNDTLPTSIDCARAALSLTVAQLGDEGCICQPEDVCALCACRVALEDLKAAPVTPPPPTMVVGDVLLTSVADFAHRCEVQLAEEQAKLNPDNALIALLCDGVRLAREFGGRR